MVVVLHAVLTYCVSYSFCMHFGILYRIYFCCCVFEGLEAAIGKHAISPLSLLKRFQLFDLLNQIRFLIVELFVFGTVCMEVC